MSDMANNPLRLKPYRWSDYESLTASPPDSMVATYQSYSWKDQPVRGSPYEEIPLFWTPHHGARTVGLTVLQHFNRGYCPVSPLPNSPIRRPRAIIYSSMRDAGDGSYYDLVPDVVTALKDRMQAKGVWASRALPTPTIVVAVDEHDVPCQASAETAVCFTPPVTSREAITVDVIGTFVYDFVKTRILAGSPYQGGEVMYIDLRAGQGDVPNYGADENDPGVAYQVLPNYFAADMAFLTQVAGLHDRCLYYNAWTGDTSNDITDPVTGLTYWEYKRDFVLPAVKAALGSNFAYSTVDGSTPTSTGDRNSLKDNIRQAIIDFFKT